jgi:amino acid permease
MDAGNVADAVNFANDLVKSLPNCVDSFQCAGIVAYMNGELSTSIVAFEKVPK